MSTKIYLYNQRHPVILVDTSGNFFERRYKPLYTKQLKAHKGTTNRILIEFMNQDQRPVDITNNVFICRLITSDKSSQILEKELTIVNAFKGQAVLTLTEFELETIPVSTINFSIEQIANINEPVYIDDHANSLGQIVVVDSIHSSFKPSFTVTISDSGNATNYTSSIIKASESSTHSFQFDLVGFIGTIQLEGSVDQINWFTIDTPLVYTEATIGTTSIYAQGKYMSLRVAITNNTVGTINSILYR